MIISTVTVGCVFKMIKSDCRECIYHKYVIVPGHWDKNTHIYIHPTTQIECIKTFKTIKVINRQCKDYVSKKQTNLFGEPVKRSGR